jgi:hypothetical protein
LTTSSSLVSAFKDDGQSHQSFEVCVESVDCRGLISTVIVRRIMAALPRINLVVKDDWAKKACCSMDGGLISASNPAMQLLLGL